VIIRLQCRNYKLGQTTDMCFATKATTTPVARIFGYHRRRSCLADVRFRSCPVVAALTFQSGHTVIHGHSVETALGKSKNELKHDNESFNTTDNSVTGKDSNVRKQDQSWLDYIY
jgi:hypothetical protein